MVFNILKFKTPDLNPGWKRCPSLAFSSKLFQNPAALVKNQVALETHRKIATRTYKTDNWPPHQLVAVLRVSDIRKDPIPHKYQRNLMLPSNPSNHPSRPPHPSCVSILLIWYSDSECCCICAHDLSLWCIAWDGVQPPIFASRKNVTFFARNCLVLVLFFLLVLMAHSPILIK